MPTEPTAGCDVFPVTRDFTIEAGEVSGQVIAMQFIGTVMNYLVLDVGSERPVWIQEEEITRAYS